MPFTPPEGKVMVYVVHSAIIENSRAEWGGRKTYVDDTKEGNRIEFWIRTQEGRHVHLLP